MILASIAQVVFAIIIVILLMVGGFAIYNYEFVRATATAGNLKKKVIIFSGMKDLGVSKDEEYDTHNNTSSMYRDIAGSVNQRPGTVFSYNFWLWKDNTYDKFVKVSDSSVITNTDPGLSPANDSKILILKGTVNPYKVRSLCGIEKSDIVTKAPLIKLERGSDVLTVEFNTVAGPDVIIAGSRNSCSDKTRSWSNANAHKLSIANFSDPNYNKKWFMVSVVVQDTFPTDNLPGRNKVRCRVFINGRLELDHYVDSKFDELSSKSPSILQSNDGNLYVSPRPTGAASEIDPEKLLMADLAYFNYALEQADVNSLYSAGITQRATNNNLDVSKIAFSQKSAITVGVGLRATSPLIPF